MTQVESGEQREQCDHCGKMFPAGGTKNVILLHPYYVNRCDDKDQHGPFDLCENCLSNYTKTYNPMATL
jgi:hypothetical protein